MYTKSYDGFSFAAQGKDIFKVVGSTQVKKDYKPSVAFIIDGTINNPPLTGIAYRFIHLTTALARIGYRVHWIVGNRNHQNATALEQFKSVPAIMHFVSIPTFYDHGRLAEILREDKIEVAVFDIPHDAVYHISNLRNLLPELGIVVQCHDIEAALSPYKKKPEKIALQKFLQSYICQQADSVISMTPLDRGVLIKELGVPKRKLYLAPNGVWPDEYAHARKAGVKQDHSIVFVGNMYYQPNAEAIEFYADQVFPAVLKRFPDCMLKVVGMTPPSLEKKYENAKNIKLYGAVQDFQEYLSIVGDSSIAICPVFSGSGMKVKILEFSALGLPVLTTNMGQSGYERNKHLIIQNKAKGMVESTLSLLNNPSAAGKRGLANQQFVKKYYDWNVIAEMVHEAILNAYNATVKHLYPIPYRATWLNEGRDAKSLNKDNYRIGKGKIVKTKN